MRLKSCLSMEKAKYLLSCVLWCIISLSLINCSDDDDKELFSLKPEVTIVNFKAQGDLEKTVGVSASSTQWSAVVGEDGKAWCYVQTSASSGSLTIRVDENTNPDKRSTQVLLSLGNLEEFIQIEQLGYDKDILVGKEFFNIPTAGSSIELVVTSNVDYDVILPDWISEEDLDTRATDMVEHTHSFTISSNSSDEERVGYIEFANKSVNLLRKVSVIQEGLAVYDNEDTEGIEEDLKIKIVSGEASSFQKGSNIELAFDGNTEGSRDNEIYHSSWNNEVPNYFPITLTFNLEENTDVINYLIYYPRTVGSNGNFKEVEIRALCANESEYVTILEYDFEGSSNPTRIDFEKPLFNPKSIQFVVKSGVGSGQGFASCAEMEFYKYNPDSFDPLSLFKDITCSELKDGITLEEIEQCKYPFYKNLAFYMLNGRYDTKFRVAEYSAYPHPDIQGRINKTNTYSLLDNPTGISVKANEEIIVFVGETQGKNIVLTLQNLDMPGEDGANFRANFPLVTGVNKFTAPNKGLLYILYHNRANDKLDTYKEYKPVKIHFATGAVNGYFDSQIHTQEDWTQLLNNTTSEYFDVLGKYAHLTFPVMIFKANTPDGLALINTYDEIVSEEWKFMGLMKYDTPDKPRIFRNRMYFNVMYKSYMYSTAYRTAYHVKTLPEICNVDKLRTSSIWGPAHEVGHSNQTRPGLRWHGTTEVTNNIMSQHIQTLFGNESRLQSENMGEGRNRFENSMTNTFRKHQAHAEEEDVFCKLVPFWQLELFFSWVQGNRDFYKDIYEDVRLDPDKGSHGENQVWFAVRASKSSGYDLTEFFEKWGFFKAVDVEIDDYSIQRVVVTDQMAAKAKAAIQALGLPKPEFALEYITDNTVSYYKNDTPLEEGTYTINDRTFNIRGCNGAVAFEVYDDEGLLFVSSRATFIVPDAPIGEVKVYAVSCRGFKKLLE